MFETGQAASGASFWRQTVSFWLLKTRLVKFVQTNSLVATHPAYNHTDNAYYHLLII
jgi:hypothetical protein